MSIGLSLAVSKPRQLGRFALALIAIFSVSRVSQGQISYIGSQFSVGGNSLASPESVALDSKGNLYIADQGNNRIVGIPVAGSGLGTPATLLTGLSSPSGVAADWSGNVYVADTGNNQILMLPVASLATGQAVTVAVGFSSPTGIAVDAWGNLYVADSGNNRVMEIPFLGGAYGTPIALVSGLNNPQGVAVDAARTLYIADTSNNRVLKCAYTLAGYPAWQQVGYGLKAPVGVSVDKSDNVFIADTGNSRVLEELWFAAASRYNSQTVVGSLFNSPQAVGEDFSGKIYVADNASNLVEEVVSSSIEFTAQGVGTSGAELTYNFNIAAGTVVGAVNVYTQGVSGKDFQDAGESTCLVQTYAASTICGVNIAFTPLASGARSGAVALFDGQSNVLASAFLNGTGLEPQAGFIPGIATQLGSQLSGPAGVAVDGSGDLFIADTGNNRVVELPWNGTGYGAQFTVPISGLVNPMGLAIDGVGNLYVVSNGNDKVVKLAWTGTGFGPPTRVANGFYGPTDVAVDAGGNVYITDTLDNVLVELPWAGTKFGSPNYLGNYHKFPGGVAVDGTGNVYFTNPYQGNVEEIPWGGSAGSLPQTQLATPGVAFPSALAVDGNANLYILDSVKNQLVMLPWSGTAFGSPIFIAGGFNAPAGLAVDAGGNLYVADTGNNQVVKIALSTPAPLNFADTYLGSTSEDSAQTTLVANIGNQPLTFTSVTYPSDFPEDGGAGNPCTPETQVSPGTTCQLSTDFTPQATGSPLTEAVQIANNSLGGSSVVQAIAVSGSSAGKLTQTLTFSATPASVYGASPVALSAFASSGLTVSYTLVSGPAAIASNGLALNILGVGTVVISAAQSGNSIYAAAPSVTVTIVVAPAILTITPNNLTAQYGAVPTSFAYTISGFVNGQNAAQAVSGTAVVSASASTPVGAGSYALMASTGTLSAANYTFSFVTGTLTVTQAPLTVAALPSSSVYGAGAAALPWSLSGFVNGDNASVVTGAPGMSPAGNIGSQVGIYTVTPSLGTLAAANYSFVFVASKLTVTAAMLTVSVTNQSMTYGTAVPAPQYAISGFVLGDTAAGSIKGVPAIALGGSAQPSAGTYAVTPSLGSLQSANYVFTFVPGTLTVSKALLQLLPSNASMVYGSPMPVLAYIVSGFVYGDTQAVSCVGVPTVLSQGNSRTVPGTYAISGANGSMSCRNYSIGIGSGLLTISKAMLTIKPRPATITYGAAAPNFAFDYVGFVNGDGAADIAGGPSFTTTVVAGSPVGSYAVAGGIGTLASAKYNFSIVGGTLAVTRAVLSVSPVNATMTYGGAWPRWAFTVQGLRNGESANVVTGAPVFEALVTKASPVGVYPLNLGVGSLSAANYTLTFTTGQIAVTKATLTVTPVASAMIYGSSIPSFKYVLTGFVNGDAGNVVSGSPSFATVAGPDSPVGTYAVVSAAGTLSANNYAFVSASGRITVGKAVLSVIPAAATMTYGSGLPTFSYTLSGFVNGDTAKVVSGSPAFITAPKSMYKAGVYTVASAAGTLAAANYSFSLGLGQLTVVKAVLSVVPSPVSMRYGGRVPAFTYTLSGFVNGDSAKVVSGSPVFTTAASSASNVGSYAVQSSAGTLSAANYTFSSASGQLTVSKAALLIEPSPVSMIYGGPVPAFTYIVAGFVNGDSAKVVSGSPAFTTAASSASNVGSYAVQSSAGTLSAANYTFSSASGQLTVSKAALLIEPSPVSTIYGGPVPAFTYTLSGFVNGDSLKVVSGSAAFTTAATSASNVGSYAVQSSAGTLVAANYTFSPAIGQLTISKAILSVIPLAASMTYGSPLPAFTYTLSGFVNGDSAKVVSGSPAFQTTASSTANAGSYAIESMPGTLSAGNYAFVPAIGKITINKAVLTIVPAPITMVYGTSISPLAYQLSGFVNGDSAKVVSGFPAFKTSMTSASGVGTYSILASSGNLAAANYSFVPGNSVLIVTPAALTITAKNQGMIYGASVPALSYGITGLVKGDTAAEAIAGSPLIATAVTSKSVVGQFGITAAAGTMTARNYTFQFVSGAMTVSPATLTLTAQNLSMEAGAAVPTLTYVFSGWVNGDTAASATTGTPLLTTSATAKSAAGSYAINASQGTLKAANYQLTLVNGTLTVTQ